ncbi:ATP-binding protein [uncultured Amphritea sp.]|uniref:ATP-binding protein n=1 Tax=uncultured Amphritea sp. TaxID=981605 RepID=UPI002637B2E2|nr:ATP-binding protein [uncultured Amphritea sp.]
MRHRSIKRQLVVSIVSIVTLIWLASSGYSAYVFNDEINEVLDDGLIQNAKRLIPLALHDYSDGDETKKSDHTPPVAEAENESYFLYQIRTKDGYVTHFSHDIVKRPFSELLVDGFQNLEGFRVYTESIHNGDFFVQVAEPLDHRAEAVVESLWGFLVPLLLVIPVIGFMVWWLVGNSLMPLFKLNSDISERGSDNLTLFDHSHQPVELLPITSSLNDLMQKISQAIYAEREFASNSAHELRTPVASLLAQTQRLIAVSDDADTQQRAADLELGLKRLQRLSEKLLQLSRADASVLRSGKTSSVMTLLPFLIEEYQRGAKIHTPINCDNDSLEHLVWPMDMDAAAIILRNLIENALRYGHQDQPILIYNDGDDALHVVNSCDVIPADKLQRLTNRFERGSYQSEGAGLGLAIVDTFVKHSAGTLAFYSPAHDRTDGFEVVIRFS